MTRTWPAEAPAHVVTRSRLFRSSCHRSSKYPHLITLQPDYQIVGKPNRRPFQIFGERGRALHDASTRYATGYDDFLSFILLAHSIGCQIQDSIHFTSRESSTPPKLSIIGSPTKGHRSRTRSTRATREHEWILPYTERGMSECDRHVS